VGTRVLTSVDRLRAPGGWLYVTTAINLQNREIGTATSFVPEPVVPQQSIGFGHDEREALIHDRKMLLDALLATRTLVRDAAKALAETGDPLAIEKYGARLRQWEPTGFRFRWKPEEG
jgi:hypothetical protein